ncbi:hypothetical protein D3C71_1591990 [compost metagenome]
MDLDAHHGGVGCIANRHTGVERRHQKFLGVRCRVLAQQLIWLIGDDFEITGVGFTGQAVAADFRHRASLAFPLGLDVKARVTLGRILSNTLGKLLQGGYVNTIQVIRHLVSPLWNAFLRVG